ncbi:MAG TPA: malate synthase G, partial [Pseudomonadales bacterium]|nr:malate synthase G [Pseudomonadales bacterium]
MQERIQVHGLQIARELHDLVRDEMLPGTGIEADAVWRGFDAIVREFAPRTRALLLRRDELQAQIDAWHRAHPGPDFDRAAYRNFLERIGYLLPEGEDFTIGTDGVDDEIARIAGPQLVVPVMNARYALNAANARWGSLYDALYGTNAIAEDDGAARVGAYNPVRGARVIAFARRFLDQAVSLHAGSWSEVTG